MKVRTSR
jgi:hypothetical protein